MRRVWLLASIILTAVVVLVIMIGSANSQEPESGEREWVIASESDGLNQRFILGPEQLEDGETPEISFIDTHTSYCYQPDPAQNVCYINWYQHYVDTTDYMIAMTVTLESRVVAAYRGFFQNYLYANYAMHHPGFRVTCGEPGAGGNPSLGNVYAFTIRARDSSNLKSANYGSVYCPPYIP